MLRTVIVLNGSVFGILCQLCAAAVVWNIGGNQETFISCSCWVKTDRLLRSLRRWRRAEQSMPDMQSARGRPLWHHRGLMQSFLDFYTEVTKTFEKEIRAASQFCSHIYYFSVFGILLTVHIKCGSNRRKKNWPAACDFFFTLNKLLRNMYRRNTRHVWNMKQRKSCP